MARREGSRTSSTSGASEGRRRSIAHANDADALKALGYESELKRSFSPLAMLGLAFAILNSWTALSASLNVALPSGGPTSVIWGLVTAGIFNLALAVSLAEFLSAYPTAAGQLHWTAVMAPPGYGPVLSYFTGWINVGGWLALAATGGLLGSQFILGIASLIHPEYELQRWHQFLIYIAINVIAFLVNAFANRLIPLLDRGAIIWSIGGFVIVSITVLACASPNYSSGDFVFREFINTTGWPDGVAWLLGLLQGGFGLTGYDAVAHMIEEIPNPAVEGPKVMIYCVCIGTVTGFIFLVCLLFVAGDIEQVIKSTATPLVQILYNATNNYAGTVCLMMFPLICVMFAIIAIFTTSSRMAWAFARDNGLLFNRFFGRVDKRLDMPVNALLLTFIVTTVFGCVLVGSSAAFSAITAASVIALGISYAIPVALNMLALRRKLPAHRAFRVPEPLAWICNILGVAYALVTTVLFFFPPALPTDSVSMNYAIVAFGIWMILAIVAWFVTGRKTYTGPKTQVDNDILTAMQSHPNEAGAGAGAVVGAGAGAGVDLSEKRDGLVELQTEAPKA